MSAFALVDSLAPQTEEEAAEGVQMRESERRTLEEGRGDGPPILTEQEEDEERLRKEQVRMDEELAIDIQAKEKASLEAGEAEKAIRI